MRFVFVSSDTSFYVKCFFCFRRCYVVVFISVSNIRSIYRYYYCYFYRDSSGRDQNICHSTAAATAVVAAADAAKVMECSQNERIFYVYKYIAGVSTLFGCRSNISTRPILVRIEFTNIDAFNEWLYNHRPIHRIQSPQAHKGHFIFDHGLLYHDACSLRFDTLESIVCSVGIGGDVGEDVLAVEIKPKQGWNICTLPESLLKLMEIGTDVRNRCRFCAMQHLKV